MYGYKDKSLRVGLTRVLQQIEIVDSFQGHRLHHISQKHYETGNIFTSYTSGKGLVSRLYKEPKELNIKKSNDPVKKWNMEQNRKFSTDKI